MTARAQVVRLFPDFAVNRVADFRLLLTTLGGLLLITQVGAQSTPLILDAETFRSRDAGCLDLSHPGTDFIAEYLDADGEIRLRTGSWMGRDARFLLPVPASDETRVQLTRLGGLPLDRDLLVFEPCPAGADHPAIAGLMAAQNLRLARYKGQSVETADIRAGFRQMQDNLAELPDVWKGIANYEQATFLRGLGELEAADNYFTQAETYFEQADAGWGQARALNGRGLVAWRAGDPDQAWWFFDQALQWWEGESNAFETATIFNNMGLLLTQEGRLQEASESLELALDHFQGPVNLRLDPDPEEMGARLDPGVDLPAALTALNNLARVEKDLGRLAIAERYWRTYIGLGDRVPSATAVAQAQLNLGDLLFRQGRPDEALLLLIDAQNTFEISDARTWNAQALNVLGQLFLWLGDIESARSQLERAQQLGEFDINVQARTLTMLAHMNLAAERYGPARQQLEQARELFDSSQSNREKRIVEAHLVEHDCRQQEPETCLEHTARLYQQVKDEQGFRLLPALMSRMGELNIDLQHPDQAERLLNQALDEQIANNDSFEQLMTLERLSRLYRQQMRPDELVVNQQAIDLVEAIQQGNLPPMRQAEFLALSRSVYDRQVRALLEQDQMESAWATAERARARSLRQLRLARQRGLDRPGRKALLDQRATLLAQRFKLSRFTQTSGEDANASEIHRIGLQLDRVESEIQRLNTSSSIHPEIPGLSEIQASLHPNEALLSYYLGNNRATLWTIRSDTVRTIDLGDPTGLDADVNDLISRLRHPRQGIGAIARNTRSLRQRLVEPVATEIEGTQKLYIQPDGSLHGMPFVLLFSEYQDTMPELIQTHSWRGHAAAVPTIASQTSRLIVADPAWTNPDNGLVPFPENSLIGRLVRDQTTGRLPGTRREAEAIVALDSASEGTHLRLGRQATREFVINGGLRGYQQIHLATHGLVDLQYPGFSALLLASESALGPAFLRPHEIAELDLDAELVVLSGCETGAGKILAGEGALSLARPFLIAGAEQVLASLWKIDDHRTAEFMQRFYQHLLNDDDSAARALSRAQNWMRRQPGTAHPYFWAGFILIQA